MEKETSTDIKLRGVSKNLLHTNLRCNLLLIREAFRTLTKNQDVSMEIFYKALNIYPPVNPDCDPEKPFLNGKGEPITAERASKTANDIYTNAILKGILSDINHGKIFSALINAGVPERYIRKNSPARLHSNSETYHYYINNIKSFKKKLIDSLDEIKKELKNNPTQQHKQIERLKEIITSSVNSSITVLPDKHVADIFIELYIMDTSIDKKERSKLIPIIDSLLDEDFGNGNKNLAFLLITCKVLLDKILPTAETDLRLATMVLNKIPETDFTESTYNSEQYAEFITSLAKTISIIEKDFPEFYAVAQQMKEDKSAQSIMNEISNNLKSLNNMVLIESDAKSDSCMNMLKEISETMKNIYSKME